MKAVIYCRVSTDQQADDGYSLREQERLCRSAIESHEWEYLRTYVDDGYSGKTLERPAMKQLIADIQSGDVEAVLVYKLDRLSRSLRDTMTVIEDVLLPNEVALVSLRETLDTSTPWGRAMIGILASFNQLDRETIIMRTRMGKNAKAAQGGFIGGNTPYGYSFENRELVVVDSEAEVVREIYAMRARGTSLREIAARLAAEGVKNRHGGLITFPTIQSILKNKEMYLGKAHGVEGAHTPILREDV